jgi:starch phosphorylase
MDELIRGGAMPEQLQLHDFGSVPFAGRPDALVERHLLSDAVVYPSCAYERQRFEAVARSVRDILAQRWIKTQSTYDRERTPSASITCRWEF